MLLDRSAHATEPNLAEAELATARALFDEGVAREDAKDWTGALERFKRVAEIRVTPQVLYNMALCYERLGKTATADSHYARVIDKGGAPELVKLAKARREELKTKIPEVVLDASDRTLTVTLDGAPATLGAAVAIDPGRHEVVSKRGADMAKKSFEAPTASGKLTITVPIPIAPVAPTAPPPPPLPPPRTFPPLAYVTGGLTIAAAGVGVYGVIARGSTVSDLDKVCGPNRDHCPASARSDVEKVGTTTTIANIGLVVAIAAALVTVGVVYLGYVRPKPTASAFQLVF